MKWILLLLAGCRQIYGLDDPQIISDSATSDSGVVHDDGPPVIGDGSKDPTLVAYFTFDTISDGAIADITGNGHTATCSSNTCPTLVEGMFGKAAAFDDDPLSIANEAALASTGPFTITAWVYFSATPNNQGCLISRNNGIGLCIRTDGSVDVATRLPQTMFRSEAKIGQAAWTFVAVTYAANATTATLYIGSPPTAEVGNVNTLMASQDPLLLGSSETGSSIDDYESRLDNLEIYARVLDSDAITVLASGGAP